jgi:hypothetical protein
MRRGGGRDGPGLTMMKPFPAERMLAYPISKRADRVRNDDESILAPI